MAKQRMINTKFWTDSYISELNPSEKLVFVYLLTNPHTDICGVYELPIKYMMLETGLEKEKLIRILKRFAEDHKIYYLNGWVAIVNFAKHQLDNPKVKIGIKAGLERAPKEILDRLSIDYDRLSHFNSNINLNSNLKITSKKDVAATTKKQKLLVRDQPFSLSGEIKKLEENPRREMNIIALYFDYRKPDLQSYEQYEVALSRHLKPAKKLIPFTDNQIIKAIEYAKREYEGIYTLETLIKILTK